MVINEQEVAPIAELNRAGYTLVQEHDFLPKQYFLIFQSAES